MIHDAGKSSLTVQFVDEHFVESYYPTIENTFSKIIKYKGQEYATEIIDTAGQVWELLTLLSHTASYLIQTQDEYSILNSKHFIGIHGYVLVYSVASMQSFEMVQVIRDKILNHLVSSLPLQPTPIVSLTPCHREANGCRWPLSATRAICAPSSAK